MANNRQKRRRLPMLAAFALITLLALLLSTAGVTLAKYVSQRDSTGAAVAKPFYFSSDLLSEQTPYHQLEDTGEQTVRLSFALSNFIDDKRCTDVKIQYSCKALDASGVVIGEPVSGSIEEGGFNSATVEFDIDRSYFADGKAVKVVAETSSPYAVQLSAQFGFAEDDSTGLHYDVSEQGSAVVLTVRGGSGENVTVNFPSELVPDYSNDIFSTAVGNSVTFKAEANTSYALVFLKTDTTLGYSPADFAVSVS